MNVVNLSNREIDAEILRREAANSTGVVLICLADVTRKSIAWLWQGLVAIGKVTVLAGDGGIGKSTVLLDIAARTSRGARWPDGSKAAPLGSVIILAAEDDAADTILPRIEAAGGDCNKIFIVPMVRNQDGSTRSFNLQSDLAALESKLAEIGDVRLIIIDPVSSYLGKVDSHKNNEVRSVVEPLGTYAAKWRAAIVCNNHFSKATGGNANSRVIGSVAFVNQARSVIIVTEDPEDKDRRFFIPSKSNISRLQEGLAFRLEQTLLEARGDEPEVIATRIAWESGPISMTADEVVAALRDGDSGKTAKAEAFDFLEDALAGGPKLASEMQKLARDAGHTPKSLRSARASLGVKPTKAGFDGGWVWALPDAKMPSTPEDAHFQNRASSAPEGTFGSCDACRQPGSEGNPLGDIAYGSATGRVHRGCRTGWIVFLDAAAKRPK